MPNHVKNVWTIKGLSKKEVDDLVNNFTRTYEVSHDDGSEKVETRILDFAKIVPEPKLESECPEDCKVNKDSHVEEDKDRPWFDWYTWRCKYWGTKWNTYDGYTIVGKTQVTFVFETAWNLAVPVLHKLELFNHSMDIRFADEDYGANCGILKYHAGECVWTEQELKNPGKFAIRLWDKY